MDAASFYVWISDPNGDLFYGIGYGLAADPAEGDSPVSSFTFTTLAMIRISNGNPVDGICGQNQGTRFPLGDSISVIGQGEKHLLMQSGSEEILLTGDDDAQLFNSFQRRERGCGAGTAQSGRRDFLYPDGPGEPRVGNWVQADGGGTHFIEGGARDG